MSLIQTRDGVGVCRCDMATRLLAGQTRIVEFFRFCLPTSLYNLIHKANFVHNLFLVYLLISTRFGRICAHHQEKQLCLCDTWAEWN